MESEKSQICGFRDFLRFSLTFDTLHAKTTTTLSISKEYQRNNTLNYIFLNIY